jgi:hypothetical protein
MSFQQIRDLLHPEVSEEDVYRLFDQCGEWVAAAERRLDEHDRYWADMTDGDPDASHTAAAAYAARTRADLAAVLDELRQVQASVESVVAKFSDVRSKIENQYMAYLSTRESPLAWMLAGDDEPGERTRREATLRARELMAQYEQTTNDELAKWPSAASGPTAVPVSTVEQPGPPDATTASTTDFLLMNGPTMPVMDGPTKPIRSHDAQSPPAGATGLPGGAFSTGSRYLENETEHRGAFGVADGLFSVDGAAYPQVIGEDAAEYTKDEDESW